MGNFKHGCRMEPISQPCHAGVAIKSAQDLGALIKSTRKEQGLTQREVAGIGRTGNRVIVDIENGKPTVQLQKVLDLLDLLGLQLEVKTKDGR